MCNINPDNPFNTNRISSNCLIKKSIPNYDYYFIWSNELKYKLSETYPNTKFIYLPFAVDDFIIPVFNNNFNYCYNLSFIGNSDKERFFKLNLLLNSHQLIRENLMVFGNGWDSLNFKSIKGQVNGNDYFITFNKTKININILRDQNRDAHNMRTFEIPASCAFMLHEYSKDAIDLFKPGEEAEYYQSVEEFLDKFKFYLNNDSIREKIALSAYNKSRTFEYSYKQRAQLILNEITK
ncbi:MAG: hypothetical protein KatS3mg002_1311 [Candidatus Woesearchaeota archaeon]|nr:MAG: hypothetical protein KatS3mg002_1311 [Candidatus Woesearchaeota archaeon]